MSSYAYTTFGADEVIRPRETCAALHQNREQGDWGNSAITRRRLIGAAGCSAALAGSGMAFPGLLEADAAVPNLPAELPQGLRAEAVLDALPGKKPLIKLSYRPPNYETPISYFRMPLTPNDAFFVRYHHSDIPQVDAAKWRLMVGGEGATGQIELTLDDIRKMPAAQIIAVNQCSGNRRGLFQPHVVGVEWGFGGMGCARWKGARLKDILDQVGLKKAAIEIVFDGADGPVWDKTPDFVKSIPVAKAIEDTTLIAYEMNGQPLPHFNGFPARLVVPGWTGTYWVKHLTSIQVVTKPFDGFWMSSAYRLPTGKFPLVARFISQETAANTPITEMVVNSLITSHDDGAAVTTGQVTVGGIAWDGGYGIRAVEVSTNGGTVWAPAKLGEDLGRFAFRPWTFKLSAKPGKNTVTARATNAVGQTQTAALILNPAGYHHNVMQTLTLNAA
jgi:DMSO/TMAO reductase YedYZ molybdopterin-dependent catalytic subunit